MGGAGGAKFGKKTSLQLNTGRDDKSRISFFDGRVVKILLGL